MRRSLLLAPAVALLAMAALAGCASRNQEAQASVTQRASGMRAGDFFDQYGRWRTRSELSNGATGYNWESEVGAVPAGPLWLDERVCKLRIVADKVGRIESAVIVHDTAGRVSTSRCGELFRAH